VSRISWCAHPAIANRSRFFHWKARHDGKVFLYAFDLIELSGERQVCEIRPGLYPARSIFCTAVAV
jgi:hypothetical protein